MNEGCGHAHALRQWRDERAIRRIMALLIALAVLASGSRPAPFPFVVSLLPILRRRRPGGGGVRVRGDGHAAGQHARLRPRTIPADANRLARASTRWPRRSRRPVGCGRRFNDQAARPGFASGHMSQCPGGPCLPSTAGCESPTIRPEVRAGEAVGTIMPAGVRERSWVKSSSSVHWWRADVQRNTL